MMTYDQILPVLTKWHDVMRECNLPLVEFSRLVGGELKGTLPEAVICLMSAYTDALANACGFKLNLLEDWGCDHNFGETPMEVGLVGEPMRSISTIEGLAQLMADWMEVEE